MIFSTRLRLMVLLAVVGAPSGRAEDNSPPRSEDARRAALLAAGYTAVPFTLEPRPMSIHLDGAIGPERVKFMLDTGCRETVLDLRLAKRLKLDLGEATTSIGIGGKWVGRQTHVPGIAVGPYDTRKDWSGMSAEAGDLSAWAGTPGGVLGTEVLDPLAAVVDYPARTLYLRPPLVTVWPKLAGNWAVTSWQEDGAARELDPKAPPTLTFADRRLRLSDGGRTREYALRFGPNDEGDILLLLDPKRENDLDPAVAAAGLVKVGGGKMTICVGFEGEKPARLPAKFAAPKGSGHVLLELKSTAPAADTPSADPLRDRLKQGGYTAVRMDREPDGTRRVSARVGRHDLRLMVDTGVNLSAFDAAGLKTWGAEWQGGLRARGWSGAMKAEDIRLRGLQVGEYDTRRAWVGVNGAGIDLGGVNQALSADKRQPIQGLLGNFDLLNGSAVVDFGTSTLYLRPAKDALWPRLEGKWVGVAWEQGGQKGQYAAGMASVEFKEGRVRFTTSDRAAEWACHVRDEAAHHRLGLFDPKADERADGFAYTGGGIFKLAGDTLTLLLVTDPAKLREEPHDFAAPAGSGLLLVEYKRAR